MVVEDNAQQTDSSAARLRAVGSRLRALAAAAPIEVEDKLIALLRGEQHPAVKRAGVPLLADISRGRAVPLLVDLLGDEDKALARAAYRALGLITGEDFWGASEPDVDLARAWQRRNSSFVRTCSGIWTGKRWEPCTPLDPGLAFDQLSCGARPGAVSLQDPRRSLRQLLLAARGQDKEPRRVAIQALATREGRRLAPSFMPSLLRSNPDEGSLIAVITAAGESHLADQVPWLLRMAQHENPKVAGSAA